VTGWSPGGALEVTSPHGRESLTPDAVLLATGCRERPRSARLVPGSRPEGVLTTGMLQQLVYLRGRRPGRRALVVGAEHVSFSALQTLAHGGARVVGMVTELPRHQTLALVRVGARLRYRAPLLTRTAVTAINGAPRVEEVELTDVDSSETRRVACDTVVFTADWIPDHELAVLAGAALDPGTRGPAVDLGSRTTRPGLFAAGNVIHAAEPADIAALSGRRVAAAVIRYLDGVPWPAVRVPVECVEPLHWISPNAVTAADPSTNAAAFHLRAREILGTRTVEIAQDGRLLWRGRVKRLMPGRSALLPAHWTDNVDPSGTAVSVRTAPR
jgi:thioredoxin reductase